MKIRNYIVENYQLLMASLEEELCKNGISYVRIDNEIHFLDYIIRFYDFEIDKSAIIWWGISKIKFYEPKEVISIFDLTKNESCFIPEMKVDFKTKSYDYQPRNKSVQKLESNLVKQKLKKYSR